MVFSVILKFCHRVDTITAHLYCQRRTLDSRLGLLVKIEKQFF